MRTSKVPTLLALAKNGLIVNLRRNVGISAVIAQKVADPIQKLFVEKAREYAQMSKASGGKLVDASPEIQKAFTEELDRIKRQYSGGSGVDLTKFPNFSFQDPVIDPINMEKK